MITPVYGSLFEHKMYSLHLKGLEYLTIFKN